MDKLVLDLQQGDPRRGLSAMARGLTGSGILKIAGEIRQRQASGASICNLTIGDFSPKEFPIPRPLLDATILALQAGETNYPPADGMLKLREAVRDFYRAQLKLDLPVESVLIAGGARSAIYATYRALIGPGDAVVFPVPSWNNNHYAHLSAARGVPLVCSAENGFLPTAEQLAPLLRDARLLVLNSPLNPAGTVLQPGEVKRIAELLVAENRRREPLGERPLYLLWNQICWQLTYCEARHTTPLAQVPESAPYVVMVDGISKSFSATGFRVGWAIGPRAVVAAMRDIVGHVGAWAPRAEQVATAEFLRDGAEVARYVAWLHDGLAARLDRLHGGLSAMAAAGLPVRSIAPQGAIYLSAQFDLVAKKGLSGNEAIRKLLLEEAGFAVVPFQAFGFEEDSGWFRLSVGGVSEKEIEQALPRVEGLLRRL
jgi:aspartate aminotransferase